MKFTVKILHFPEAFQTFRPNARRIDHRPGNIVLCPAVDNGLRHILAEIIHVAAGNYAKLQRLSHSQHGSPIYCLRIQLILKREYLLRKPVLQRHVFTVPAHQRHRRMSVSVEETAHQQAAPAVYLPVMALCGRFIPDI